VQVDLPHVRDVEEPRVLAHRAMLGQDPRVLHRHLEAGELDQARAEGAVAVVEGRAAEAGGAGRQAAALVPEPGPFGPESGLFEPASPVPALSAAGLASPPPLSPLSPFSLFFEPFELE
jgi:hypothetical protein